MRGYESSGASAKLYALMRRIGEGLVRDAVLFDAALLRFDREMTRIEVSSYPRHPALPDSRTPEDKVLDCLPEPDGRYVKHFGVWHALGELMRFKRTYPAITENELERSGLYPRYGYRIRKTERWLK